MISMMLNSQFNCHVHKFVKAVKGSAWELTDEVLSLGQLSPITNLVSCEFLGYTKASLA